MALFFRGAVTSSPVKTTTQEDHACHSFDESFFSDSSYECISTNPVTGSVCVCRRSPRLLTNGYYVLTEDSVVTDDEGNLTLTPTQTNISYKENLVRIFRRRRKVRSSLASLLNDVSQSCQSWLGGSVFSRTDTTATNQASSWLDVTNSTENDAPICFTYDPTETLPPPDKQTFLVEEESQSKVCSAHEQPSLSLTGLLDVPPPTESLYNSYRPPSNQPDDGLILKGFVLFILTLCLCATVFSRWVTGGIVVVVAILYLISSIRNCKPGTAVRWNQTKTETFFGPFRARTISEVHLLPLMCLKTYVAESFFGSPFYVHVLELQFPLPDLRVCGSLLGGGPPGDVPQVQVHDVSVGDLAENDALLVTRIRGKLKTYWF